MLRDRYHLELFPMISGYDRKTCWVQAHAGAISTQPGCVVMTMQKLLLTGSDVFYELNEMRTDDGGETWSGPIAHTETMGRRIGDGGRETVVCDFCPRWHAASGTLLGTGHSVMYENNVVMTIEIPRHVAYSAYHPETRTWNSWDTLKFPKEELFFHCGSGCSQRWDCEDGTILLPVYATGKGQPNPKVTIVRCGFDGTKLTYIERGQFLERNEGRGYYEASLANFNVTPIDENETWIIAAEWMQNNAGPGEIGTKFCEQFGSDNTIWAARIRWC